MKKNSLVSSLLVSGALLSGLAVVQPAVIHAAGDQPATGTTTTAKPTTPAAKSAAADEKAAAKPAAVADKPAAAAETGADKPATAAEKMKIPENQKVKLDGKNDKVDAKAVVDGTSSGDAKKNVGSNGSTATFREAKKSDGTVTGGYKVLVKQGSDGRATAGSSVLYKGDTTYYTEKQADGSYSVNSIMNTGGTATTGTQNFEVDVAPLINGTGTIKKLRLTDGVEIDVIAVNKDLNTTMSTVGKTMAFTINFFGKNMQSEATLEKPEAGTDGRYLANTVPMGFAGIPMLFHYYDAAGALKTGTLTLGIKDTPAPKPDEGKKPDPKPDPKPTNPTNPTTPSKPTTETANVTVSATIDGKKTSFPVNNATILSRSNSALGYTFTIATPKKAGYTANTPTITYYVAEAGAAPAQMTPVNYTKVAAATPKATAKKTTPKKKTLPQTGEAANSGIALAGLATLGLVGAAGTIRLRKHNHAK